MVVVVVPGLGLLLHQVPAVRVLLVDAVRGRHRRGLGLVVDHGVGAELGKKNKECYGTGVELGKRKKKGSGTGVELVSLKTDGESNREKNELCREYHKMGIELEIIREAEESNW